MSGEIECWPGVKKGRKTWLIFSFQILKEEKCPRLMKDGKLIGTGEHKNWELGVSTWLILILPDIPKGGFSFFPLQRLY